MTIFDLLQQLVEREGSDIHIIVGSPLTLRIDGELETVPGFETVTAQQAEEMIFPLMTEEQKELVAEHKEHDFGYQFQDKGRFRINVYQTKDGMAAALRLIPARIKSLDELNLPPVLHEFANYRQGLILLTGPTGEGKSTTLAALIDEINTARGEHILTIEDPIEFVYTPKKSVISQREIGQDTNGWKIALRSALREDPDVVLVGEMRDLETIAATITLAETGHLVFATLHTSSAAETIDRIIDVFPAHQQGQVRQQLAETLKVVVSQRLLPKIGGGRVAAQEIMITNSAIKNLIREQKTHQVNTIIQTNAESGMMLIETHLARLQQQGLITVEEAYSAAFRPEELERLMGGTVRQSTGIASYSKVQSKANQTPEPAPAPPSEIELSGVPVPSPEGELSATSSAPNAPVPEATTTPRQSTVESQVQSELNQMAAAVAPSTTSAPDPAGTADAPAAESAQVGIPQSPEPPKINSTATTDPTVSNLPEGYPAD